MTMIVHFDPDAGLIVVPAIVTGPKRSIQARLAVDTGATVTMLNAEILRFVGVRHGSSGNRSVIMTANGLAMASEFPVNQVQVLGHSRKRFPVICHTLPPTAAIDGLLGLNFLKDMRVTIDFRKGEIAVK